jgi:hypothetical protein
MLTRYLLTLLHHHFVTMARFICRLKIFISSVSCLLMTVVKLVYRLQIFALL